MNSPSEPSPAPTPSNQGRRLIVIGFLIGIGLAIPPAVLRTDAMLGFLLLDLFVVPVCAGVLCIFPVTRKVGLGLLLACGLGWLVMLCICGGMALK